MENQADSESDENNGGSCTHCHKSFDNLGSFLRHVSHSKLCKASYDADYLKELKMKSKRNSRKKFYRTSGKSKMAEKYKVDQQTTNQYFLHNLIKF